jgi:hypothetical protein
VPATVTDMPGDLVVRVVGGGVGPEEMAAVMAVLLSKAAESRGRQAWPDPREWRWRAPAAFLPPHSWQAR